MISIANNEARHAVLEHFASNIYTKVQRTSVEFTTETNDLLDDKLTCIARKELLIHIIKDGGRPVDGLFGNWNNGCLGSRWLDMNLLGQRTRVAFYAKQDDPNTWAFNNWSDECDYMLCADLSEYFEFRQKCEKEALKIKIEKEKVERKDHKDAQRKTTKSANKEKERKALERKEFERKCIEAEKLKQQMNLKKKAKQARK